MNSTDVIRIVRDLVKDNGDFPEYRDPVLVMYINDGVRLIRELSPESRLDSNGLSLVTYADVNETNPSEALILTDTYFNPLVEYVLFRLYDRDSGDTRDKVRAQRHYDKVLAYLGLRA